MIVSANVRRADLALVIVSLLWGLSFPAIKMATPFVAPVLFVAVRFTLAACVLGALWPLLARTFPRAPAGAAPAGGAGARRRGMVLGLLLAGSYTTQTIGLRDTTAANSAFLSAVSVVLVPLVVAARWRRLPDRVTLLGLALATAGLVVMTRPDLGRATAGDLWTLACALIYAVYLVALNEALAASPYPPLLVWQIVTTAAVTLAWALAVERGAFVLNGTVRLSLGMTVLLSTLLALYLQNRFQGSTTATRAGLIFSSEPIFATGFAALLLGEAIPRGWGVGAALILAAVLVVELLGRRREAGT